FGSTGNTGSVTINGGKLSNTGSGGRTIPSTIGVNLAGNFTVDDSLSATQGQILFSGPGTIKGGDRTITVSGAANLGRGGAVGEDVAGRSLTKDGTGTLPLTASNTYSASPTI